MKLRLSIIIPTKDRAPVLAQLLASLKRLNGLTELRPEIIVADNGSQDDTPAIVRDATNDLPTEVKMITTTRAGKSAALNDALKIATGDYVAFLDDDVVVDMSWLWAVEKYIRESGYQAGQGTIGLQDSAADDPKVRCLIENSANSALLTPQINEVDHHRSNFFIAHKLLDRLRFHSALVQARPGPRKTSNWRSALPAGVSLGA
jgi:glycosyltransferase involved in cell wall biosynthesis